MPTLQIRDVPPHVYSRLARLAQRRHRGIAQQALHLLEECLVEPCARTVEQRCALLDAIAAEAGKPGWVQIEADTTQLMREDRRNSGVKRLQFTHSVHYLLLLSRMRPIGWPGQAPFMRVIA